MRTHSRSLETSYAEYINESSVNLSMLRSKGNTQLPKSLPERLLL